MKCRTVLSGWLCTDVVIQLGYLIGINLVKSMELVSLVGEKTVAQYCLESRNGQLYSVYMVWGGGMDDCMIEWFLQSTRKP